MPTVRTLLVLALGVLVAPPGEAQEAAPFVTPTNPGRVTLTVNCETGDSIRTALTRTAHELVIEIRGVCTENIEVRRDRVTLRGADPTRDGIVSAGSDPDTLRIRQSRQVTVEALSIGGAGSDGLKVVDSHELIRIANTRMEGNGRWGASVIDSTVDFLDATFTGNGLAADGQARGGLLATDGSNVTCMLCIIESNPATGANLGGVAFSNSRLSFTDSRVEASTALLAQLQASIDIETTQVTGSGWAFQANFYGNIFVAGGRFTGALLGATHSNVQLFGATQTFNPTQNFITETSTLVADDRIDKTGVVVSTTLVGLTIVTDFSNGKLVDNAVIENLACTIQGSVYCDGTESKTSAFGCPLCP